MTLYLKIFLRNVEMTVYQKPVSTKSRFLYYVSKISNNYTSYVDF